jgi:hypothetical protein
MNDQNISHDSSDYKSNQVKGNMAVAGVTLLAATALVIGALAGFA